MTDKRRALGALTKNDLLLIGRSVDLDVAARMTVDELREAVAGSKRATLDKILPLLGLKEVATAVGVSGKARDKQTLIGRILGGGEAQAPVVKQPELFSQVAPAEPAPPAQTPPPPALVPERPMASSPPSAPPISAVSLPPAPPPVAVAQPNGNYFGELEVDARKPRLAWQGMWRKEVAVAVPTQVVASSSSLSLYKSQ